VEKRKKLTKKYQLARAYSYEEYDQALSQVDAVYLVLANHLHRDTRSGLQRRVHVPMREADGRD